MERPQSQGIPMYAKGPSRTPLSVPALAQMKTRGERITAVTAYDSSMAARVDEAGIDLVLVGDSLGMVVQGHASTLPVTMDQMVYHTACVARGLTRPVLMADLPFMAFRDPALALTNATRLMAEGGAAMVKLEGAGWVCEVITALAERDVPVCAHLGLTPQSVHALGGYRVQGKTDEAAEKLLADAHAVAEAGAALLVLECVPTALAATITREVAIPVIGIGAGPECDGQILVIHDLLGITPGKRPRFSKDFLAGRGSMLEALAAYASDVREGHFPAPEHSF